jgi:plastocyanin
MAKQVWAVIVIVVIILIGGGIYFANKNSNTTPSNNSTGSTSMNMHSANNSTNQQSSAPTATDKVDIKNFAFSPADITVKVGTTVTWTNSDSTTHTVTETDGQDGPNSGNLEPGKTYTFTYNTAGTFKYHCAIHPEMLGTVTVTQ